MLKQLRSGAAGFFAKLLLGLLTLMFVFWGIKGVEVGGQPVIASVGPDEIRQPEFEKQVSILRRNLGDQLKGQADYSVLYRRALEQMIAGKLLSREAERLKLDVSDDMAAHQIGINPSFKNAAGEFDKLLFQQFLRQNGFTEQNYVALLKDELQRNLLLSIFSGQNIAPKGYDQILYTIENEVRQVDLVAVSRVKGYVPAEPQPSDLQAFYDAHKKQFEAPEFRKIEVIRLAPQTVLGTIDVSRQEVFDLYNKRLDSLLIPEKRDVYQLLYNSKAEAESAYNLLRAGKDMKKTVSMVPPSNKDSLSLGYVTKEQLPAGGAQIFSLSKGEFSQPIESPFGWHVFLVKAITEKHATSFDDVRKTLEAEIRQQKGEKQLADLTMQLQDALAGSSSLDEAAKIASLSVQHADPVSATGIGADNRPIFAYPADKTLLDTAFKLPVGKRSELEHLPDGGYYVIKVDAVTAPRQRTLDEVRGQVTSAWKAEQLEAARKKYAAEIAQSLKNAADAPQAEAMLERYDVDVSPDVSLRRNGSVIGMDHASIPIAMTQAIFALAKPGQPTAPSLLEGQGYVIALLKNIQPAQPHDSPLFDAAHRSLEKDYENELFDASISDLKMRYPVKINEALLARMTEQP